MAIPYKPAKDGAKFVVYRPKGRGRLEQTPRPVAVTPNNRVEYALGALDAHRR
jgi:hypothetical protein